MERGLLDRGRKILNIEKSVVNNLSSSKYHRQEQTCTERGLLAEELRGHWESVAFDESENTILL